MLQCRHESAEYEYAYKITYHTGVYIGALYRTTNSKLSDRRTIYLWGDLHCFAPCESAYRLAVPKHSFLMYML